METGGWQVEDERGAQKANCISEIGQLRTVVLIVARVHRDPELLIVTFPTDYSEGNDFLAAAHRRDHTRTVGDNGDCLSRDAFQPSDGLSVALGSSVAR